MRFVIGLVSLWLAAIVSPSLALAKPPAQFQAWAAAGPELKPVPEGWKLRQLSPSEKFPRPGSWYPLKTIAARGQYVCLQLPLFITPKEWEGLERMTWRADVGEIKDGHGAKIPADCIDLRISKAIPVPIEGAPKQYRMEPFLLEKRATFTVAYNEPTFVWVTVKVPEDAKPGIYSGRLNLASGKKESWFHPIEIEVLPFVLPPVAIDMGMSFYPPASDALLAKELIDLREHGVNYPDPTLSVQVKTRDRNFGPDDVRATLDQAKRMMAAYKKVYGKWDHPITLEVGHQIAYYWDQKVNWFVFWPHSPRIDDDLIKAIDTVATLAKAQGWPPLRIYAMDEAGAHRLLDEAVYYYGLVHTRLPGVATWTDIGGGMAMGYDEIGKLTGLVDVLATNRFTPDIVKALLARKKPYGIYNGSGPTAAGTRYFFGFWAFKSGSSEVLQWAYHFGDSPFKGSGLRQEDEGYVYETPDGPIPSIRWEAVREGITDYRYVQLLWRMIAAGENAGGKAKEFAQGARMRLMTAMRRMDWDFMAMDKTRRSAPPDEATLQQWRVDVASDILLLIEVGKVDPTRLPPPPPVDPLKLPWAGGDVRHR